MHSEVEVVEKWAAGPKRWTWGSSLSLYYQSTYKFIIDLLQVMAKNKKSNSTWKLLMGKTSPKKGWVPARNDAHE